VAPGGLAASASPVLSDPGATFLSPNSAQTAPHAAPASPTAGQVPAWKTRALELESKIIEYAAELAELRNTYFSAAAANAIEEGDEDGEDGQGTGGNTPSAAAGESKDPSMAPQSDAAAAAVAQSAGAAASGSGPDTIIPACTLCGCSCAEQRRQQALNAAAILKGISVLDRGRAIKPGLVQSSRFGSYSLRQ